MSLIAPPTSTISSLTLCVGWTNSSPDCFSENSDVSFYTAGWAKMTNRSRENPQPSDLVLGGCISFLYIFSAAFVAILDSNETDVVQYKYDAWGKQIGKTGSMASTLGTVQPFRYRGYVYDEETELFYLEYRYYMPSISRFINADRYVATGEDLLACNMFSYCENSPVVQLDPTGTDSVGLSQYIPDNNNCFKEILYHDDEDIPNIVLYKPHTKNARPSTQNKHQEGESRKKKDARGEKGDNRRKQDRSNKRKNNTSKIELFCTSILLLGAMIYVAGNDITGVGAADDAALAPMGTMLLNNIGLLFR